MNLTYLGIFLEGILSFLSPCVLPLLPLYMSYLAGEDKEIGEDGVEKYKTGKVFITTVFFVLGICLTLTLLAVSVDYISKFLDDYKEIISIICGVLLIVFAFHETGIIHIDILDVDKRIRTNLHLEKMSFIKAFTLGFVFSLGWSPCIGPMLANALMLAATETSGYLYIVAYGFGLIIPFLITGLLTSTVLNFFNTKKNIMKWVLKIAGIIMLCFGVYMISNASKDIMQYKNKTNDTATYLMNYEFKNQDGKTFKLSDYKGKYIILNFSTTWCTYCAQEIPDYLQFSKENDDVVCLYVMSPVSSGVSYDDLITHINNNIELQVLIDENNELASYCNVRSYPTKYIISPDSEFLGYISGATNVEGFEYIMEQAKQMSKEKDQN